MTTKQLVLHRITAGSSVLALMAILLWEIADTCADLLIPNRKARDDRDLLIDRRFSGPQAQNRRIARLDRRLNRSIATRGFRAVTQYERRGHVRGRRSSD